jgi:hypothetical protein
MAEYRSTARIILALALLLVVAFLSTGQDTDQSSAKKPYVPTGNEVTISGTVALRGRRPKPFSIDMSADPDCYAANRKPRTEWFVGNKDKVANVLVYVKSEALDAYIFEPAHSSAVLEHQGCRYVPHVMGMQLGQSLVIHNRDSVTHNTHINPTNNPEWNQTQQPGAPPLIKLLELPESLMRVKDNQHPWERAYIGIVSHPFFAVTDQLGSFKIEGLPAGRYTVVALHERLGEKTIEVNLAPRESKVLKFKYEVKASDFAR